MKTSHVFAWMKRTQKRYLILALAVSTAGLYSFTSINGKPWVAPEAAAKKANPVKSSADVLKTGKDLFAKHCASCHGKMG